MDLQERFYTPFYVCASSHPTGSAHVRNICILPFKRLEIIQRTKQLIMISLSDVFKLNRLHTAFEWIAVRSF